MLFWVSASSATKSDCSISCARCLGLLLALEPESIRPIDLHDVTDRPLITSWYARPCRLISTSLRFQICWRLGFESAKAPNHPPNQNLTYCGGKC